MMIGVLLPESTASAGSSRGGANGVGAENVGTCPEQYFYHSSPIIETGSSQITEQKCSTSHNADHPARSIPFPYSIYKSPVQNMC
jgi:hypothetical protein